MWEILSTFLAKQYNAKIAFSIAFIVNLWLKYNSMAEDYGKFNISATTFMSLENLLGVVPLTILWLVWASFELYAFAFMFRYLSIMLAEFTVFIERSKIFRSGGSKNDINMKHKEAQLQAAEMFKFFTRREMNGVSLINISYELTSFSVLAYHILRILIFLPRVESTFVCIFLTSAIFLFVISSQIQIERAILLSNGIDSTVKPDTTKTES